MTKNILFLVTGMTPQIITETLWALACDPNNKTPWVPNEIHVASTERGLDQIRARLFDQGVFAQMQNEYPQLKNIQFNNHYLHSIIDKQQQPISDLKTPEDNELAADFICNKVREFTTDKDTTLHISIAGGRKTMGFYAGYALSVYGRAQDRMSHVLVDENYEVATNFFYPSQNPNAFALNSKGIVIGPMRQAKIWLAEIPFVRLRGSLPTESLLNTASFSEIINSIDLAYNPISIEINLPSRSITISGKTCKIAYLSFAFLYWFAYVKVNDLPRIERPIKDIPYERENEFIKIYLMLNKETNRELDQVFFDEIFSKLRKSIADNYGLDMADKILPKLDRSNRKRRYYDLNIPKEKITIKSFK